MQTVVKTIAYLIAKAVRLAFLVVEVFLIEWFIRATFPGSTPHFVPCAVMWALLRLLAWVSASNAIAAQNKKQSKQ